MIIKLNLQQFAEEETAAAAPEPASAETATAAESAPENVTINAGDTLEDGQVVSSQVAAAMNRQMARHPELRQVYGQAVKQGRNRQAQAEAPAAGPEGAQAAEKTIEQRWDELKKGEFSDLFGRDVKNAIQDRFKNQADANGQLNALEPMLKVLRERAGVQSNDELIRQVLDDDSLYEDAANEAGMTTEAYKQFLRLKQERDALEQREQQSIRERMAAEHTAKLVKQAEELKKQIPDFDLRKEYRENEKFRQLIRPEVGLSVEDAYFATHRQEMMPQAMAYGMERAKQQMGQTLQAQRRRPAEGAMKAQGKPAADFNIDPRQLTRKERNVIYDLIHKGKLTMG